MKKPLVLDSWAMMAFFEGQASAERVAEIIIDAHRSGSALLMCVVNAGELWYSAARGHSRVEADRVINELSNLQVELIPADWTIARQAAEFKAKGRIAYADCFAAALAKQRDAEVVTGDKEFKVLEDVVYIHWI
jgi:ribonuclease VapC